MRKKPNKLIYLEEYVLINGIDQFLLHSGTGYKNPVMLFLHGGPGSVTSLFAHEMQEKWEEVYTVVHWDQRGAGKTLTKNPDKLPTINLMLLDLFEVIQYLKKKYNKQKIVLLGHSWGSVLGSTFIRKYPEEVAYYIGAGQVIDMTENERVGYGKVKKSILKANDNKSLKRLESIGDYPGEKFDGEFIKKCMVVRKLQQRYNLSDVKEHPIWKTILTSPIFKLSDIFAARKALKVNEKLLQFLVESYNLKAEKADYKVPVYYILGDKDWESPFIIAKEYFNTISAPDKKLYMIPDCGHVPMMDQPELFSEALLDIYAREMNKDTNSLLNFERLWDCKIH